MTYIDKVSHGCENALSTIVAILPYTAKHLRGKTFLVFTVLHPTMNVLR